MAHVSDDGRQAMFHEVMARLDGLQAKYRGVRGELLKKVRDELMQLAPTPAARASPPKLAPTCRACGRQMESRADGSFICQNGHTRLF
jgi:hypothetical protein